MNPESTRPPTQMKAWQRLWVKLALFSGVAVLVTHAAHLTIGSWALREHVASGWQAVTRLAAAQVSRQAALGGEAGLQALVQEIARTEGVGYCLVERGGRVVASSTKEPPPAPGADSRVLFAGQAHLEQSSVVPGGRMRIGFSFEALEAPRRSMATIMGLVASMAILVGLVSAFAVGRRVSQPIGRMVAALRRINPAKEPVPLREDRQDEIGFLVHKVNEMRQRLHEAYLDREQVRRRQGQMEKMAALGSLVAGVAHEINNPLAGLLNCQQRLRREDLPDDRRQEYLELMKDGLTRIQRVVGQLLHFSRARAPERKSVPVIAVLTATQRFVSTMLDGSHKRLEVDFAGAEGLMVWADPAQIEQALVNLLLNAAYVTPRDGAVELRALAKDGRVGIAVRDRGPGIPEEIRHRIEDPFFTTKPEGEGTGLGLSVTRSIADSHQGDLTFEFPAEGGTLVTLWLPVASPTASPPSEEPSAP